MKIVSFNKPNVKLTLAPGSGMTCAASGGSIAMNGRWHYEIHKVIKIKDSGSFELSLSGLDMSLSVIIGVDKTGHPTIRTTRCSTHIGSTHIHFHGGASWLYRLFDHYIEKAINRAIEKQRKYEHIQTQHKTRLTP
ncbi:hypothetical protein LSAT2_028647 [Lamellibrachia satsuma]|nr:hypothetical protein LSAT2_028647 [Lamellibrachia satsuma]